MRAVLWALYMLFSLPGTFLILLTIQPSVCHSSGLSLNLTSSGKPTGPLPPTQLRPWLPQNSVLFPP